MFSLRTHALICGTLFAALIGVAVVGNVLQRAGVIAPPTGTGRYVALGLYFALFIAFGLSAIPVIVKLVVGFQAQAGNENVPVVAAAIHHQNVIIWTLWGLIGAGLVIAIPAAIVGGMFSDGSPGAIRQSAAGNDLGVLAAKPNMTLDEVVAASTLKLDLTHAATAISGGQDGQFEYRIPGTSLRFPGARYYYMTTYRNDSTRLEAVNIGVSNRKLRPAALDSADIDLRARLGRDGWLAGHEMAGQSWLKDGVVLDIRRKRLDDAVAGEDPATAGEWIQYVELWSASTYPGFARLHFQAANTP